MSRPHSRLAAPAVAVALVLVVGAGVAGVAQAHGAGKTPTPTATGATAPPALAPRPAPARLAPARADRAVRSAPVAPLARLIQPDVIVAAREQISPAKVRRLLSYAGVDAVAVLDAGHVSLGTRHLTAIGVEPNEVRAFTPSLTAQSDALWQSVARGDMTVSYAGAHRLRHRLGRTLLVRGRHDRDARVRLGAFASLGLGNAQVLVDHVGARMLGLRPARRLVISAPRLSIGAIEAAVHRVLGGQATVHGARPETVDQSVISAYARETIPAGYLALYRAAAGTCAGLPWTVLAAIGAVETGHGADTRTSSKGAVGPMQFLPSTFAAYGIDGNGDGAVDIRDPSDAVYSAARYLCLWGAGRGGQALYDAVWAYNHADWYVREVLAYAVAYS